MWIAGIFGLVGIVVAVWAFRYSRPLLKSEEERAEARDGTNYVQFLLYLMAACVSFKLALERAFSDNLVEIVAIAGVVGLFVTLVLALWVRFWRGGAGVKLGMTVSVTLTIALAAWWATLA